MKQNESAIFEVTCPDRNLKYTVMLTGVDNSGTQVSATLLKVPTGFYSCKEKYWSWAYASSTTSPNNVEVIDGEYSYFNYSNTYQNPEILHGEDVEHNQISPGSVSALSSNSTEAPSSTVTNNNLF